MAGDRRWPACTLAGVLVGAATAVVVTIGGKSPATTQSADPPARIPVEQPAPRRAAASSLVRKALAPAVDVLRHLDDHPELARTLEHARPVRHSSFAAEAALAAALEPVLAAAGGDAAAARRSAVRAAFADMTSTDRTRVAVEFAGVVGNLPGAPFVERILANRLRMAATLRAEEQGANAGRAWRWDHLFGHGPAGGRLRIATFRQVLGDRRQLLFFDPMANDGWGSYAELVGRIGPQTRHVGLFVPGGGGYLASTNSQRYYERASGFVDATADGSLAILVWAAGEFPGGYLQEAMTSFDERLAPKLTAFSKDLREELGRAGSSAGVTAVGHSYGGAVVGTAERLDLDVDRVVHVASAGVGVGVHSPRSYRVPSRPRYSMTAPGDWIGYFQGLPMLPGFGHGGDPDEFPGVVRLATGNLPADRELPDETGQPLRERAGGPIRGRSAHSTVFVRYSDAWHNMHQLLVGGTVAVLGAQAGAAPRRTSLAAIPAGMNAERRLRICRRFRRRAYPVETNSPASTGAASTFPGGGSGQLHAGS